MNAVKPKVVDIRSGKEPEVPTVYLPEATAVRLAEQMLICARDVRDENGLLLGHLSFIPGAFEKAPRIAVEAVARVTGTNVVFLDPAIRLKGGLAPIHERPSAFRNDRKRHEK
jgi:hypothetical protein